MKDTRDNFVFSLLSLKNITSGAGNSLTLIIAYIVWMYKIDILKSSYKVTLIVMKQTFNGSNSVKYYIIYMALTMHAYELCCLLRRI